jgi:hypothetical protein
MHVPSKAGSMLPPRAAFAGSRNPSHCKRFTCPLLNILSFTSSPCAPSLAWADPTDLSVHMCMPLSDVLGQGATCFSMKCVFRVRIGSCTRHWWKESESMKVPCCSVLAHACFGLRSYHCCNTPVKSLCNIGFHLHDQRLVKLCAPSAGWLSPGFNPGFTAASAAQGIA